MAPQGQRGFGQVAQRTALTADQALAAALKAEPNGKPSRSSCPVQQRERPLTWRTQISRVGSSDIVTVTTDDHRRTDITGDSAALRRPRRRLDPVDPRRQPQRPVWAIVVTLTGIFPTIFAVTGIIMWLRKRSDRKELAGKGAKPRLRPAE